MRLALDRPGGRVVGPTRDRPGSRYGRLWRLECRSGWDLGWDVRAAVGVGGSIGAGRGAGLAGLALVAAQVGELFDGAEEAAAEVSVVAGQVDEGLGAIEHR